MRVIKRYRNRRLYDTRASRTITQRDLADLIRHGEDVSIVDTTSGKDITAEVLARILVAETAARDDIEVTKNLYTTFIELGGESMSILKNTVLASIGAFEVTKTKAEKLVDELIKRGEVEKSDRSKAVMEVLDKAEQSTAKVYNRVAGEVGKAQKEIAKYTDQVKQYKLVKREDIQKLEKKVDKLNKLVASLEKKLDEQAKAGK